MSKPVSNKDAQIMEILLAMAEMYERELSRSTLALYIEAISDLPIDSIREAALHIVNTRKFTKFPMPAEFRDFVNPPALIEIEANKAWRTVEFAMMAHGYYKSVGFKDPAITQTILAMGGWMELCNRTRCDDSEYRWLQREFEKRYAAYRQSGVTDNQLLLGCVDSDNMKNGYYREPKEICYVGFDDGERPQIGWTHDVGVNRGSFKSIASVVAQEE